MARPLRLEFPGAVYHVTSRGNARQRTFRGNTDRRAFLETLASVVKRFNWLCHAYCLMDNHYHLMIETPEANLAEGMRQLNGVYTQLYNRKHDKIGHLFQGRYKAILVEKETYLAELCRYVVLNPVRAGMAQAPGEWKWSSYAATAGLEEVPAFLSVDWILGLFGTSRAEAEERYREFVQAGTDAEAPWKDLKAQVLLGREGFLQRARELLADRQEIPEIPRAQRYAGRPSLMELLGEEQDKNGRNSGIHEAHVRFGYRLKEIADYLRIHYTTVSKVVNRLEPSRGAEKRGIEDARRNDMA